MTYDEWAAIGHAHGWLGARTTDGATSVAPLRKLSIRAGSQRHTLLEVYAGTLFGFTDEEAGTTSGLARLPRCCYWKRCSELRQAGYIETTGDTRLSTAGEAQQVCRITKSGTEVLG